MEWIWANWQPWWDAIFIVSVGGIGALVAVKVGGRK